ncbi:MAG: competence/damage-inducible protein A [Chloroflexi bacterium]|nr:competence/damage-inducible protein A [Chloroflexota bacterium]
MKAEIVSVGTELLLGHIVDTNAAYLAQQLSALGFDVYWISQVGDNQSRIVEVFRRAWSRSDVTIVTGGIGPTEDDLTRESIAELMGETMTVDPRLEKELRERFAMLRSDMPATNVKQAALIPSAQALPNPVGTAPGWWLQKDGRAITAMPGVPAEMRRMWANQVQPRLAALGSGATIVSRTLKVIGKGESWAEEMVRHLVSSTNPTLATYAKQDGVHLRMTAKAATKSDAERMMAGLESELRKIFGTFIYGTDDDTLEKVVGDLLRAQGLTISTMESSTGGLLSSTLTDTPGASDYFKGGLVTYSAESKRACGVRGDILDRHGTVSPETAEAMATAVRESLGTDIGVSITGVFGPDELEGKPVGTMHIGVDNRGAVKVSGGRHQAGRAELKRIAVTRALNIVRRELLASK